MTGKLNVGLKREHPDAIMPAYAKPGGAGMDFFAYDSYEIAVGKRLLIPTGWAMAIPKGYELQIRPRSGLALKHGITVANSPGTVDSGYRGEIGVILINHGKETFNISRQERIAQGVLAKVEEAEFEIVSELSETERGTGGFGHAGK